MRGGNRGIIPMGVVNNPPVKGGPGGGILRAVFEFPSMVCCSVGDFLWPGGSGG